MEVTTPLSDSSDDDANEITAHDEAGHAVMAHLFDCPVYSIRYGNVKGIYNGVTWRGLDESQRKRDPNVPYDELRKLGLQKEKEAALINAAGKAAQRIWYRKRSLDESLASYGSGGEECNDEVELEKELLKINPRLKSEELPKQKQDIEELAIRLLETKRCWEVVEAVAQASLEKMKRGENFIKLIDIQKLVEDIFAQAAMNEKT